MPKEAHPSAEPITLSTNAIFEGRFYNRGEPLPVASVADLPENLQKVVATEPEAEEEPNEARGSFELNTIYEMTDDNRLGRTLKRNVQRQVAELEDENARADWIEEEVNSSELPPDVAQDLQAEYERDIEMQRAQAQVDARRSDEVSDAAAAALEPPQLYVRRGSRHYAPALSARLKAGESVFTRNPEGRFEYVGIVNGHGELPDVPIQL